MSHPNEFAVSVSRCVIAINGYVADTLPGLVVAQHQTSRWHLLNVGSGGEFHAVHFHGIPFSIGKDQEHRMGIFNLYPGKHTRFAFVQKKKKSAYWGDLYPIYQDNRTEEKPKVCCSECVAILDVCVVTKKKPMGDTHDNDTHIY